MSLVSNISVIHDHLKGWVLSAVLSPSTSFVLDSISSSLLETKICQKGNTVKGILCHDVAKFFFQVDKKVIDLTQ